MAESDPKTRLDESLKRFEDVLANATERERRLRAEWIQQTGAPPSPRMQRRLEREMYRRFRREARHARLAGPMGWVPGFMTGGFAAWFFALAAMHPTTHGFLAWVGLGFGMASARFLRVRYLMSRQGEQAPAPRESAAPPREPEDARVAKVDALCDKLLAELKGGSAPLKEIVRQPEQTVQALRSACHQLVKREQELRQLAPREERERVLGERQALAARRDAEQDAVVRERLTEALKALDEQLAQREALATAATRLEAEHMRLYYTLESLYMQVLRVKSADASSADVAGAGLRQSLGKLGEEIDAVADALEAASRGEDLSPISPISSEDGAPPARGSRERV